MQDVYQKKRNTTLRMRSVAAKIVTAQLQGWHILVNWLITVFGSLTRLKNLRFCGQLVRKLSFSIIFLENLAGLSRSLKFGFERKI